MQFHLIMNILNQKRLILDFNVAKLIAFASFTIVCNSNKGFKLMGKLFQANIISVFFFIYILKKFCIT